MSTPSPETAALLSVIETLQATNARQAAELSRLVRMVEGLTRQLDALLNDETRRAELAALRAEVQAASSPPPALPPKSPRASRPASRSKHGRGSPPAHLPRDTMPVLRPERCASCGHEKLLAEETLVSEEYDYVRAHVRVRRTEREVCRCARCDARVTPPQPPMPFDRVSCTFEMMAWLLFAKGVLFLPLDRLVRDFKRQGAPIPSATATRWWQRGADLAIPLAAAVRDELLLGTHLHLDGTGLYVVFPRLKARPVKGPAREGAADADGFLRQAPYTGQVLIFGDGAHAVYHFAPSKEAAHIEDFLVLDPKRGTRWTGTITADAANVHDRLFTEHGCIETGCNAHGLRKFRDEADKAPLLASKAMAFVGKLYEVEGKAREQGLVGAELLAHRREHARPIADAYRAWLDAHLEDLLPKNPVRKAMQYTLNHWDALTRFIDDPDVPIDNNAAERDLRKVALLRKNALYASGVEGAERLCAVLTLAHTCVKIEVDPYGYLVWALSKSVPHPDNRGLKARDLTPAAYKAEQQRRAQQLSHPAPPR